MMTETVKVLIKTPFSIKGRASVHVYDEEKSWALCRHWIRPQKLSTGDWNVEEMTRAEWEDLSADDRHDGACQNCKRILRAREKEE